MNELKKRFIAGKVYTSDIAIPIQRNKKTAIISIGESPSFLGNVLKTKLFKMIAPRVGYASKRIILNTYPTPKDNWGLDQLKAYRKDKLLARIVIGETQASEDTFIYNLAPVIELSNEKRKEKVSPQKYYNEEFNAIIDTIPDLSEMDHILLIGCPSGDGRKRLQNINTLQSFLDVFIRKYAEKDKDLLSRFPPIKTDLILTNQNANFICRFDVHDKRLNDSAKLNSSYSAIERYFNGLNVESEDEAKSIGLNTDNTVKAGSDTLPPTAKAFIKLKINEFNISDETTKAELVERIQELSADTGITSLETTLANDVEIKSILVGANKPLSVKSTKEDKVLELVQDKFENATYTDAKGNITKLSDVSGSTADIPIIAKTLKENFLNEHMKTSTVDIVDDSYYKNGFQQKDFVNVFKSLATDSENPLYVTGVEVSDASDTLSLKDNVRVQFRDDKNTSHTINLELPRMTNDGYFFLNGSKWSVTKQIIALPIVKVKPNQVLITTAYNKATVERFGQNISPVSGSIKTLLDSALKLEVNNKNITIKAGSAEKENETYSNDLLFEDISKLYSRIKLGDADFYFGRETLDTLLEGKTTVKQQSVVDDLALQNSHPVGIISVSDKELKVIVLNSNSELFSIDKTGQSEKLGIYNEFLLTKLNENKLFKNPEYKLNTTGNKKYVYSRIKLLRKQLPLIMILGFSYGLVTTLNKYGVKYSVLEPDTYNKLKTEEKFNKEFVKFKDSYLMYDTSSLKHSLLVNGLQKIPTDEYRFEEYQKNGKGWIDFIADIAGSVGYVKGLVNFRESLLDPVSKEILASMDIEPDFMGIMLAANTLLDNNSFREASDMSNYRIRSHEMLNSLLYKVVHREMERVRATKTSAIPQKLSVSPKALITDFITTSNVEEMQLLNPKLWGYKNT